MKHLYLMTLFALIAVVLVGGAQASFIYIDRAAIFEPGTHDLFVGFPGDPSITDLCNKAAMLSNHGKHEEALAKVESAIKINPTVAQPYYIKGLIYYNMERYQEAKQAFDWGIKIDPKNYNAKYLTHILGKLEG